tara:strand:+ start:89 stop:277 length:189 start_codon:yes stop_codon:yes gene_type:complete
MVFLREALTLVAGLAITKIIVDRTTDEPDTPDILPALPNDNTTTTDLLSEGELERGRKGFGL